MNAWRSTAAISHACRALATGATAAAPAKRTLPLPFPLCRMYDFCLTPIYAFLLAVGGVAGYLTKGSTASLGGWAWVWWGVVKLLPNAGRPLLSTRHSSLVIEDRAPGSTGALL